METYCIWGTMSDLQQGDLSFHTQAHWSHYAAPKCATGHLLTYIIHLCLWSSFCKQAGSCDSDVESSEGEGSSGNSEAEEEEEDGKEEDEESDAEVGWIADDDSDGEWEADEGEAETESWFEWFVKAWAEEQRMARPAQERMRESGLKRCARAKNRNGHGVDGSAGAECSNQVRKNQAV